MTSKQAPKDLIILVADKNMESTVRGLLSRLDSLEIRAISFDIYVHPEKDPGCLLHGHDFVAPFSRSHSRCIVMFDRIGCGREKRSREDLEAEVNQRLELSSWKARAGAVVIDPELEIWVWSDSPHIGAAIGWGGKTPLKQWMKDQRYLAEAEQKPSDPKKVFEHALRISKKARSSSIYLQLAQNVSLDRCQDQSFLKFKTILREWFGQGG